MPDTVTLPKPERDVEDVKTISARWNAPATGASSLAQSLGVTMPAAPARDPATVRRQQTLLGERRTSTERLATQIEQDAAEAQRGLEEAQQAGQRMREERAAAKPPALELPQAPGAASRAFLQPGESVLGSLQAMLLGIGQIAMQAQGLRGTGIAATAALKGLAQGWAEGDAERVKREYESWRANTETLLAKHRAARESYLDLMTDQSMSWNERQEAMKMRATINGHKALAEQLRLGDIDKSLNVLHQDEQTEMTLRQHAATLAHYMKSEADAERRDAAAQRRHEEAMARLEKQITRADAAARRADPRQKTLGEKAAHMSDAQGRHPSELDTMEEAVTKGFHFFQGKTPPEVSSRVTLSAVDQALALLPALKDKGLLMSRPGLVSSLMTDVRRGVTKRGDEDLTTFLSHTSTLIRTARELGDIGFRAKVAIEGTTNLVEKAQTAAGVEKALRQLRNLVELSAPATVTRRLSALDTRTNQRVTVTFEPGETLDTLPDYLDPNR